MWLFFSSFCVGLFPLWQGRKTAAHTIKSMFMDLMGKKRPEALHGQSQTPPLREGDGDSGETEKVSEMANKKE